MAGKFLFSSPAPRVVFGSGSALGAAKELAASGISRAVVLCGNSGLELSKRIAASAPDRVVEVLQPSRPDISTEDYEKLIAIAKEKGADGFIAVGGGTPIGLAKAISATTSLRYLAIPSTYSGSEMARTWHYGKGKEGRKGTSFLALPLTAIYDPDITLTLPPKVSTQSAMNAIAHGVESLYAPDVSPPVLELAEKGIHALATSMPRVVARPDDIEARTDAMYGAWLCAAFRADVGVEHALAQRLRDRFNLSHAGAHAVVTPYAIAFNRDAAPAAMERIMRALGAKDAGLGLYELNVRLGNPTGLKDLGMKESDIEAGVDFVAASPIANPRPVSRADLVELVTQAFHGRPPRF
jgi:maleylacetate reductase